MNDISSLPPVPQELVNAMHRNAEKLMAKDNVVIPAQEEQVPAQMNPMLVHHAEPEPIQEVAYEDRPQETISDQVEYESQAPEEDDQTRNFRAIRERMQKAERERDEALKMAKKLSEMHEQYQKPVVQEQPHDTDDSDNLGINDDDLVEGKHLGKVAKKMRELQKQLKQYEKQSSMAATEAKLKAQYPDFDQVLSRDNIETFRYAYPELAATVDSTQDVYTKAVSAYTLIKKFGVYAPQAERERVAKNIAKPRPLSTVAPQQGDSPVSRANAFANGLTKDLQEQMWKEMRDARKGY